MGQRLVYFSEYSGRVEEIYPPENGPTELGANVSTADIEWAEQEARGADSQPGLVLWTDGSRDENGGVGYAVVWRKGRRWAGRKLHMEFFREAYGAECTAFGSGSGTGHTTQAHEMCVICVTLCGEGLANRAPGETTIVQSSRVETNKSAGESRTPRGTKTSEVKYQRPKKNNPTYELIFDAMAIANETY